MAVSPRREEAGAEHRRLDAGSCREPHGGARQSHHRPVCMPHTATLGHLWSMEAIQFAAATVACMHADWN